MPLRREFAPRQVEAAHLAAGRVDPYYGKVLIRLLAAHAHAEKLTALGYERALGRAGDSDLAPRLEKNRGEERAHARMVYGLLLELGVSEQKAERLMIPVLKGPSFEAPRHFAERADGELDVAMGALSLDMTGLIMIGVNYRESSYAPHSRVAEAILEDEADHDVFAAGEVFAVVERFGAERVNAALAQWLPRAVNFFGPPGSGFTYDCLRFGLKAKDNGELAELFLTLLERRLEQAGLRLPKLTAAYPHALA